MPPLIATEALLEAGARILQFRHKGHYSRHHFETAERIAQLTRDAGAMLVINDRADIALLLGAGLHLGQDDLPVRDARRLTGPECAIGFSTHNERQLLDAAAEPCDYLALGPIFATASKEQPGPVVGLDELARLRRLIERPLVAIGGITQERALQTLAAGADSVAIIGGLFPQHCTKETMRTRTEEWLHLLKK